MRRLTIAVICSCRGAIFASGCGSDAAQPAGGSGGETATSTSSGGGESGGGGEGGGTTCSSANDCPDPDDECLERTCRAGLCGTAFVSAGTAVRRQTSGDCKKKQCDGRGAIETVPDEADSPDDDNDCTDDACEGTSPVHTLKTEHAPCGEGFDLVCNATGQCVGCLQPNDCGSVAPCRTRTCMASTCGVIDAPVGTPLGSQTPGDCQFDQCDGNGGTETAEDNADVPVDGEACTSDLCDAGSPSNPPRGVGVPCNQGSGVVCDDSGSCVECLAAGDCPGLDTECQTRTCNAGACGFDFSPMGTVVALQNPGDCRSFMCDGAGDVIEAIDDFDAPDDFNVCTGDLCTAGVPGHTNAAPGTACGAGLVCDGGGQCVGCNQPADCPGTDDECKTKVCTAGFCGFDFTAAGTALSGQTPGDCREQQCDGSGNVVAVALDGDLPPDDDNQCTAETCNAGISGHPPRPSGSACNQFGGSVCDGSGACVECVTAATCPGTDTDCRTRSCVANTCGFAFESKGKLAQKQTQGDCQVNQCDGSGNIVSVPSNGDLPPDDGNPCTGEVCAGGVPSHPGTTGNPCDDGSACTQTDTCQAGVCVGSNPVVCSASDPCHDPGSCDPATGVCSDPPKVDGSACNDGDGCTQIDTCQAGVCTGSDPVVCTPLDQCHDAGICDTGTGACSDPAKPDGSSCTLGGDPAACIGGACTATCSDGLTNGDETDIDCGGGTCLGCADGEACLVDADCLSNACPASVCESP